MRGPAHLPCYTQRKSMVLGCEMKCAGAYRRHFFGYFSLNKLKPRKNKRKEKTCVPLNLRRIREAAMTGCCNLPAIIFSKFSQNLLLYTHKGQRDVTAENTEPLLMMWCAYLSFSLPRSFSSLLGHQRNSWRLVWFFKRVVFGSVSRLFCIFVLL